MLDSYPRYEGKPTAYLDQNILNYFVKNGMNEFSTYLKENFQVLYSEETLKEIERAGIENSNKYLEALSFFEPARLKVLLNPDFSLTGEATINVIDPFIVFEEYINREKTYDYLMHTMNLFQQKVYGGLPEVTIDEIQDEQFKSFCELMEHIKLESSKASVESPELLEMAEKYCVTAKEEFRSALQLTAENFKKDVQDSRNWSGLKAFREHFKLGPLQMKNIKGPKVLEQIWDRYRKFEAYKNTEQTIDDFYGISKNVINPGQKFYKYQKVVPIYNILNFVGYYSDRRIHKEDRFRADQSDQSHASLGVFADNIFSIDEDFVYKTRAIYEYLEVSTNVNHVVVNYA